MAGDPKGIKGSVPSNSGHGWKESSVWKTDNAEVATSNKRPMHKLPPNVGLENSRSPLRDRWLMQWVLTLILSFTSS